MARGAGWSLDEQFPGRQLLDPGKPCDQHIPFQGEREHKRHPDTFQFSEKFFDLAGSAHVGKATSIFASTGPGDTALTAPVAPSFIGEALYGESGTAANCMPQTKLNQNKLLLGA